MDKLSISRGNILKFLYFDYDTDGKCLSNVNPNLVYTKEDKYYTQNVIDGNIISDEFYPVIEIDNEKSPRSLNFVKKHIEQQIPVNKDDRLSFTLALRDLFMYHVLEKLKNTEANDIIDKINFETLMEEILFINEFCPISYYPSRNFQVVRYIEKSSLTDTRFCLHNNKRVVFMRKYDLTYYNFENILELDDDDFSLLKNLDIYSFNNCIPVKEKEYRSNNHINNCSECSSNDNDNVQTQETSSSSVKQINYFWKDVNHEDDVYVFKINENIGAYLLELDKKNYYIKPFNDDQRGGLRFIFNSLYLSTYVTTVIKELIKFSNDENLINTFSNFKKANSVFRFDKFMKDDTIFKNHFDVAYVDKENQEYSLYTLVIYLRSNKDKVSLKIEDKCYKFENFDCVIFNQSKSHEGYTFDDKTFIRTDLIFHIEDKDLDFNNYELSKLFNQACYISLKSVLQPSLKSYSSELFYHFNLMKYKHLKLSKKVDYYFNKKFHFFPTTFITNGYNYFFPYCGNISIKQYILIILHDYFSTYFVNHLEDLDNIEVNNLNDFQKLAGHFNESKCKCHCRNSSTLKVLKVNTEVNGSIDYVFSKKVQNCSAGLVDKNTFHVEPNQCVLKENYCTACFCSDYNPKQDSCIYRNHLNENIFPIGDCNNQSSSIFKLENIKVVKNRIYFFCNKRVHFAACVSGYGCHAGDWVKTVDETDVFVTKNNVFIDFLVQDDIIIFKFDFFRNNVILKCKREKDVKTIEGYRYARSFNYEYSSEDEHST